MQYQQSIPKLFDQVFADYADCAAFHCMGKTLSYADIDRLSSQFTAWLQHCSGLKPGDRIAIQLPNLLQYPVVMIGALRAGLVIVNVNPQYTATELSHQLSDSGAKALVVLESFADVAAQVVDETQVEQVLIARPGDLLGAMKRQLINGVVKYVKKSIKPYAFKHSLFFIEALAEGEKHPWRMADLQPDDIALLQYTGGTTGVSKGAVLSHRNLLANMSQIRDLLDNLIDERVEIFVAPLPLYHIYAFQFHMLGLASCGGMSILIPDPRNTTAFVKAIKRFKFTGFLGINTLFNSLCLNKDFRNLDFSSLKSTTSGGMALTSDVAAQWLELTGCEVCEGFGMTEASPVVCANRRSDNQPGTVGRPMVDTQLKVIDDQGQTLPENERGELCVKGPQVMSGYWQRDEETAKTFTADGWLKTGDVAVIQPDGYVRIVDRIKDMIIVSGFNVYPNEVDDVLTSHPDIQECAVVGVPDAKTGEALKAYIVAANDSLTAEAVVEFCRSRLTAYKVPKTVEFTQQLPKSNVGKVLRRELRQPAE